MPLCRLFFRLRLRAGEEVEAVACLLGTRPGTREGKLVTNFSARPFMTRSKTDSIVRVRPGQNDLRYQRADPYQKPRWVLRPDPAY